MSLPPPSILLTLSDTRIEQLGMGLDPHADVFAYDGRILRAFRPGHEKFYEELLNHPVTRQLITENLLLPVEKSSVRVEGYPLVLEQPILSPVTYPFEWPPSMFKAGAIALLKLNIRLMENGYCTQDGHLWNILFDGTTAKFIDFSSIIKMPANGQWPGDGEFQVTCLSSLKLMEKGYPTAARSLLREVRAYPDPSLANAVLFNTKRYEQYPRLLGDVRKVADVFSYFGGKAVNRVIHKLKGGSRNAADILKNWLQKIERMDVQPTKEMWSNYYAGVKDVPEYDGTRSSAESLRAATPKHTAVDQIISRIKPTTLLDIACNRGLYSQLAAFNGTKVIGVDNDEKALDAMYRDSVKMGTPAIPLYVNIVYPPDAISFQEKPFPSVVNRLKSECVLCLALTHHLVLKQPHLNFAHIARLLSAFAEKYLVVEFVPLDDRAVQEALGKKPTAFRERFHWYTLENYKAEFQKHFRSIEIFESFPKPRVILFCRDKISD